jgi:hypothetical protein
MNRQQATFCREIIDEIDACLSRETDPACRSNLEWLQANYAFALLLDQVGRALEPAWKLREAVLLGSTIPDTASPEYREIMHTLSAAPLQKMFTVFAAKVRSRGELGELSSLNQRVWGEYRLLKQFFQLKQ